MHGIVFIAAWGLCYALYALLTGRCNGHRGKPSGAAASPAAPTASRHLQPSQNIDTMAMARTEYLYSEDKVADLSAALMTMHCDPQPSPREDCMLLGFEYQGEKFVAVVKDKKLLVEIHDPYWYDVDPRDIDKFAEMMRIINDTNVWLFGVTLSYTLDKAKNMALVSTAAQIPVYKNPAETRSYLEPILRQFFQVHKRFMKEMAKCGMLE